MAKDTVRDRVWHTALEFSTEAGRPEPISEIMSPDGFTKRQLKDAVDASDRTVHDVLKTMVDYGYLEEEEQYIAVPQGDSQANHDTTVYSAASPEQPQGKNAQDGDEQASDTAEPGESDIDDELSEDTLEVAQEIASQNGEVSLEPSQADDQTSADTAEEDLPFEPNAGDEVVFQDIHGVGEDRGSKLVSHGFESFNDLYLASVDEIAEVDGFGIKTAREMKIYIADMVRKRQKVAEDRIFGEYPETIARMFNLDEEAAERWASHARAKEELEFMDSSVNPQSWETARDNLIWNAGDDADIITDYPGNEA
jgi:predicted flap endonuclease-1-like 5' DNA nuclease